MRYNAHAAPVPIQFLAYLVVGGTSALLNLSVFVVLYASGLSLTGAALTAFGLAAALNYVLCIVILFRHRARWTAPTEVLVYAALVAVAALVDVTITRSLVAEGLSPILAKALAAALGVFLNFFGGAFSSSRSAARVSGLLRSLRARKTHAPPAGAPAGRPRGASPGSASR